MRISKTFAVVLAAFAATAALGHAAVVQPVSYDMVNGNGQASGGGFNYWDKAYTGTGITTQDGAPLAGGLGDLTDGVVSSQNWFLVENNEGTGPYVGWRDINPVITVRLAGLTPVSLVSVHVDDSLGNGGVSLPATVAVTIAGLTYSVVPTPGVDGAPVWVDVPIPITATPTDTMTITLNRGNVWVFADELRITSVPEPTFAALAFPAAALLRRRPR